MKHSQTGWIMILGAMILAFMAYGKNVNHPTSMLLSGLAVILLLLFYNLTIEVSQEFVRFSFGIGLIRKTIKLSDIEYCRPVSYFPLGWGIRFRPGAILYNVSGNKAIELSVRGKKRKIWIGTDQPDEMARFISNMLSSR